MKNLKFEIFSSDLGAKTIRLFWKNNRIFECPISIDDNGKEYFKVPNYLSLGNSFLHDFRFRYRIKDAIDTLRNGDAHALIKTENDHYKGYLDNSTLFPIYYLDEEYGEEVRQKTLKGWMDAEFETVLFIPQFYEGCYYYSNGKFLSTFGPQSAFEKDIVRFSTDIEADKVRQEVANKIQSLCDKMNNGDYDYNNLTDEEHYLIEMTHTINDDDNAKIFPDHIEIYQRLVVKKNGPS